MRSCNTSHGLRRQAVEPLVIDECCVALGRGEVVLFGVLLLWLALQVLRIGLQTHGLHSSDTKTVQPLLRHVHKPVLMA